MSRARRANPRRTQRLASERSDRPAVSQTSRFYPATRAGVSRWLPPSGGGSRQIGARRQASRAERVVVWGAGGLAGPGACLPPPPLLPAPRGVAEMGQDVFGVLTNAELMRSNKTAERGWFDHAYTRMHTHTRLHAHGRNTEAWRGVGGGGGDMAWRQGCFTHALGQHTEVGGGGGSRRGKSVAPRTHTARISRLTLSGGAS